jgi:hypothetical protein
MDELPRPIKRVAQQDSSDEELRRIRKTEDQKKRLAENAILEIQRDIKALREDVPAIQTFLEAQANTDTHS